MRRQQQRRGRGGAERGWRVSPSDRGAPDPSTGRKKPPAASCYSLSGAESQREMGRPSSPGRFSPPRGLGDADAYSSEPEAAAGEGCPGPQRGPARVYGDEARAGLRRKAKSPAQHRGKTPLAGAARRRRQATWPQRSVAPAGEGYATPCATSCTTLYGGELQAHPESAGRSSLGRNTRVEELHGDDQWASPVSRPLQYGGTDFPTDASKPPSLCPSSFSFSHLDKSSPQLPKKELRRGNWQEPCESSPSIADLMHCLRTCEDDEPQTYLGREPNGQPRGQHYRHQYKSWKGDPQISLQDFTDKRYEDLIPKRDKKVAALMLARHREEEEMKDRKLRASEAWEKTRRKEKKHKAWLEKERQYQVADSLEQWQRERDQRKAMLRLEEQQLLEAREKEMMLRDKKWKKMAKEQEGRRRMKLDSSKLQGDYRRCQEKQLWDKRLSDRNAKEHSSRAYQDQMLQALERRLTKEMEKKRKRTDMSEYKKPRHLHVKEQLDNRIKAEELYKRLCIEQKLQRSQEILEQLLEERNRELKEKSFKEGEQGALAKFRAKETEEEKRRRKEMLLQIAEMKIQQAKEIMTKNITDRAQLTRDVNCMKERNHHYYKQKLDDEKCHLQEIQEAIRRKDQKSKQMLRDKETALAESRRIAKASYDLRGKVRDLMNHGSLDQMAFDAHRNASLLKGL